jgi:hypothetical protein
MEIINIFPKTFRFFTISFNQTNDVYVKIYETAQLTMFYVFLNLIPYKFLALHILLQNCNKIYLIQQLQYVINKIKNILGGGGGVFTKIYGSEGSNFSSCFLQIKNING